MLAKNITVSGQFSEQRVATLYTVPGREIMQAQEFSWVC